MGSKLVIVDIRSARELLIKPERFCSEGRLFRMARIKNEAVRMQGFAAELALSYALSGERLEPPNYRYEKSGRPVIEGGFISLSHSGQFAVSALSPVPVGVDMEAMRDVSPRLKKRLLSERELEKYVSSADAHYLLRKFVMKEAYLKLTGEGITGGMSEIEENDGAVLRREEPAAFIKWLETDEFLLACVTAERTDLTIHRI